MMMGFVVGLAAGGLFAWYLQRVKEWNEYLDDYDRSMTQLFNSVPKEQRFGYEEDFPTEQKWHL